MRTTFSRISGMTPDQRSALDDQFDQASQLTAAEPVAVVGIGCRFPGGAVDAQHYWKLLSQGDDAIGEVPPDRWDADGFYDPDPSAPGRMTSKWGGFLSDVAGFDADFFGISPREAEAMDPQQRILLEVACEALEHAGIGPNCLRGARAAVIAGVYYSEYQVGSASNPDRIDAYCATGNAHSVTVGRIAYLLGLRGPAVAVDTACSSSLVAVHLACQSLRLRESDLALAGGVNLILRPETQLALSKWGMLSPRGRCNAFDAGADGFVRGEGAGIAVLKRLTDAVRDGDRVLAVVRGSAVNSDGRSNGLTAPNATAQRDVLNRALAGADVGAESVNFVETHGTGTALGDPIEFDALAAVYGRGDGPCALGAVKTNFGHLEAAAGIAGFLKTVLAVQLGQIPPNLNFSQWNPTIDASATRMFVPTGSAAPWPDCPGPRRAAVSSFGLGGTNAHVVVEQGPDLDHATAEAGPAITTLEVSGKTADRVSAWASTLADWLDGDGAGVPLPDVAHTLNRRRARHGKVATVCARDRAQAVAGLRAVADGRPAPGVIATHDQRADAEPDIEPDSEAGTVFVYSGQGSQWAGMGRQLMADEPAFAAAVADLEPIFVEQAGFSLRRVLDSDEPLVGIDRIQPVLVGVQLALTELWRNYGVEPAAVIGHSMGEVTAAVVAAALSPADGLRVIATRSRLMSRLSGRGAMALLELAAGAAEKLTGDFPELTVAVYAAPEQTVIAGPPEQVDAAITEVEARGLLARRIEVDVASHHPTIDPVLPDLRRELADLTPQPPKIPLLSTTGNRSGTMPFDADYWAANLRNPVRFSQAIRTAGADHNTFVEVSPHPLLTHAIAESLASVRPGDDTAVVGTLARDSDEALNFHTQLAAVAPPCDGEAGRLVDIPLTPWRHVRYWVSERAGDGAVRGAHPLLGVHVEMPRGRGHMWEAEIGTERIEWLADHKVHGQPVLPAAAFVEIALAAGGEALGLPAAAVRMDGLEVEQMLPLDGRTRVTTQLTGGTEPDDELRVEVYSHPGAGDWCRHAVARVAHHDMAALPWPAAGPASGTTVSPAEFYTALRRTGAHHGPAFAALTRIVRGSDGSADTEIALPDEATPERAFRIHPVLLDAALQSMAAAMSAAPKNTGNGTDSDDVTYLPVAVGSIRLFGDTGRRARCHAELADAGDDSGDRLGRAVLTDESGNPTAEIDGVYLRRVQRRTVPLPLAQKTFGTAWVPVPGPEAPASPRPGSWLTLAETEDTARGFADAFGSPARRVLRAGLADEQGLRDAVAELGRDPERPPAGVVAFIDGHTFDAAALTRARDLVWAITAAVRAITDGRETRRPRLWLVARNGLAVGDEPGNPVIGSLTGLVRVLAYEYPDLHASLVDLDTPDDDAAPLIAELESPGPDDLIAWRAGVRYAQRLTRTALEGRRHDTPVRRDGSYLITGGLGGVGSVVARWLVDAGAGRVVLNGRGAPSERQHALLAELQQDAEIAFVLGDIAEPETAERLVAAAEETGLALRGVLHAAAVIDDQLVAGLSRESLDRVWAPKATGAMRLHDAVGKRALDWWVGFSSVAALLGSPGQAAYAAANAWLDALVAWRRASGLPATAIDWGQWSEVGAARGLTLSALDPLSPAEGVEALQAVLAADPGRVGVARLRLDRAVSAFPEINRLGYFANAVEELGAADGDDDWAGPAALNELEPHELHRVVTARLRGRVSAIMGYRDTAVDTEKPLTDLGMDSLMAVRIRNTISGDFDAELPVALLLRGASLVDLAAELIGQLGLAGPGHGEPTDGMHERVRNRVAARQRAATRRKVGPIS